MDPTKRRYFSTSVPAREHHHHPIHHHYSYNHKKVRVVNTERRKSARSISPMVCLQSTSVTFPHHHKLFSFRSPVSWFDEGASLHALPSQ
ncbi:hypothetical protein E2C01_071089 [Portunus trituberculatus]|uniref:Uncharacterized protein n=1 Tax=Portunus trituberculatus TaxID=210409 RepID=A0A5B7I3D5_PORTR|nr:hypothetical protein [Portunus trituberculatus]